MRTSFLLELNISSLPVLAKSVCFLVGVVCVAFFLELFVCRSFCVRYFSSFDSTFIFNIVSKKSYTNLNFWPKTWKLFLFFCKNVLILSYFWFALLLLSQRKLLKSMISEKMRKWKNVFSKMYDLVFASIYDAFLRSLSIFWWDIEFHTRHLISEFRTWPRSFSSLFFFSWAWILVLSWSYDHIAINKI